MRPTAAMRVRDRIPRARASVTTSTVVPGAPAMAMAPITMATLGSMPPAKIKVGTTMMGRNIASHSSNRPRRLPVLRRLGMCRVAPTVKAMNPSTKLVKGEKRDRVSISRPGMSSAWSAIPVPIHPVTLGRRRRPNSSPPRIPARSTVARLRSGWCKSIAEPNPRISYHGRWAGETDVRGRGCPGGGGLVSSSAHGDGADVLGALRVDRSRRE